MQEIKQEKSQVKQNILYYLRSKNISEYRFYKDSGITRGILQQPNGISEDNLTRFLDYAKDVNTHWLLTGEGNMLNSSKLEIRTSLVHTNPLEGINYVPQTAPTDVVSNECEKSDVREKGAIPLVSEKAVGGFYNQDFNIAENDVIGYYVIPKFRHLDVSFMIEVIGDSMIPRFFPGDIIACSVIPNPKFIQWNKCHLIATKEQGMIIKRLLPSDNDDTCLKAVSDNKDYPPFDIPKDEICGLARIVGSIHLE